METYEVVEVFDYLITTENWKHLWEVIFVQISRSKEEEKETLSFSVTSRKYCSNLLSGNIHFCLLKQQILPASQAPNYIAQIPSTESYSCSKKQPTEDKHMLYSQHVQQYFIIIWDCIWTDLDEFSKIVQKLS